MVCGFLKALIKSKAAVEMAKPNPKVSLLIPACSRALDSVKTGQIKKTSIRILVHHFAQREWPENMRKNVRFNVFWREYVDLTDACGF